MHRGHVTPKRMNAVAGSALAAMTTLQVHPMQLHFRAAVGVDSPVTLTLFNPHPVERVAFKVNYGALGWPSAPSRLPNADWLLCRPPAAPQQGPEESALSLVPPQIKTTASSTYRVWPNSGSLEAGETARVQVLLLGTKVDLANPQRVEECRRDRFQVHVCELSCKASLQS